MPALDSSVRGHVSSEHHWATNTYGEPDNHTSFECNYCQEVVSTAGDGLSGEWRDASREIAIHLEDEHGIIVDQ